jgi:hypothetical protein
MSLSALTASVFVSIMTMVTSPEIRTVRSVIAYYFGGSTPEAQFPQNAPGHYHDMSFRKTKRTSARSRLKDEAAQSEGV